MYLRTSIRAYHVARKTSISVGDVVLVADDWKRGCQFRKVALVVKLFEGKDENVELLSSRLVHRLRYLDQFVVWYR